LQLNTTPGQVLQDNLTNLILQENLNEELKFVKYLVYFKILFNYINRIKLSTVLRMLASSASFDRICTSLLTNLINSWTGKIKVFNEGFDSFKKIVKIALYPDCSLVSK
jgi:hypothetical protein